MLNTEEYCRTCAQQNMTEKQFRHLWSTPELVDILQLLEEWHLDIKEDDNLPQRLCEDCEFTLLKLEEFRHRTVKAKKYLEGLFARKLKPKIHNNKRELINIYKFGSLVDRERTVSAVNDTSDPLEVASNKLKIESERCNSKNISEESIEMENDELIGKKLKDEAIIINSNQVKSKRRKKKKGSFLCAHCGKATRNNWELRTHLYIKHEVGEPPLTCDHCDKTFAQNAHKRLHMERHHQDKIIEMKFACHICQKQFDTDANRQRHLKFPHKPKDAPPKRLNYTIFACTLCPRKFRAKYTLAKHTELHSLEGRPYPCYECNMSFKQPSDLKKHNARKHSTARPFVCKQCPKGFANQSMLKDHVKVHEVKEKTFKCSACSRKFKFEKSMLRHQLSHTDMTHCCELCGTTFIKPEQLHFHIIRYHKGMTAESEHNF